MQILQTLVASLTLAACALLLLRLMLPVRRRMRFDAAFHSAWRLLQGSWRRAVTAPARRRAAAREARQIIERVRQPRPGEADGEWQGNVYRPKSFKRPKKPH